MVSVCAIFHFFNQEKRGLCCDILVVRDGSVGVVAANQVTRVKAKTIFVESGFQFAGMATTGGVNFLSLFHA